MKCPSCNRDIPERAKFCSFCGNSVEKDKACPKCGARLPDNAAFCHECGQKIEEKRRTTVNFKTGNTLKKTGASVQPCSVRIHFQTGKSALGTMTNGTLSVSSSGVKYEASFTISSKEVNHSYQFDQISSTEFNVTRAGLSPQFGYKVTLKDGTVYQYVYDILRKSDVKNVDNVIKSQI